MFEHLLAYSKIYNRNVPTNVIIVQCDGGVSFWFFICYLTRQKYSHKLPKEKNLIKSVGTVVVVHIPFMDVQEL